MILLVALGSSPLEVFAYNPFNEFPDQTKREWPTKDYNNVATTLRGPPAMGVSRSLCKLESLSV